MLIRLWSMVGVVRVAASHCCALSVYSEDAAKRVMSKVKKAEMSIIANSFTNLYLIGEDGKPNGLTRVKELLDAGVNVACATDNINYWYNAVGTGTFC
jgi:cytosine deaminase